VKGGQTADIVTSPGWSSNPRSKAREGRGPLLSVPLVDCMSIVGQCSQLGGVGAGKGKGGERRRGAMAGLV